MKLEISLPRCPLSSAIGGYGYSGRAAQGLSAPRSAKNKG